MIEPEYRPQSFLKSYRESRFIENLLAIIRMQKDEIERLQDEIRKKEEEHFIGFSLNE